MDKGIDCISRKFWLILLQLHAYSAKYITEYVFNPEISLTMLYPP